MTDPRITLADLLWEAAATGRPIAPLREAAAAAGAPATADEAYAIQRINRDRRVRGGDRVVGRKIGLTSLAVQRQLGVDSPDFGDLWASTSHGDGDAVPLATLIQPKVEAEVALVLERDVPNPDATVVDVIRASAFALAALEIVDSRIADWKLTLPDTVADNASSGAVVLGDWVPYTEAIDLAGARASLRLNGTEIDTGFGSAVLGDPAAAVAWLANALVPFGTEIVAGQFIMSGSFTTAAFVQAGDAASATIDGLGTVSLTFT